MWMTSLQEENSEHYENGKTNFSRLAQNMATFRVFKRVLSGDGKSPQWEEKDILLGRIFLSGDGNLYWGEFFQVAG